MKYDQPTQYQCSECMRFYVSEPDPRQDMKTQIKTCNECTEKKKSGQEIHDMRLSDILPNFRIANFGNGSYVEIPTTYTKFIHPNIPRELREQIRKAIYGLCRNSGKSGSVYDEAEDDGRTTRSGYLVPVQDWDFMASQKIPHWKTTTKIN